MSTAPPAQLSGRSILLGVCGGIAAYKACDLARLFIKAGAQVRVVLTHSAAQFVSPLTFNALTGQAALVDEFPAAGEQPDPAVDVYSHLNLPRGVDCMVVAPATADMLGKLAHGIADDLLSTAYLANAAPVLVAPAMNVRMWEHAAVQANVATLRARGHIVVGPGSGELACGDEGAGRLAEAQEIFEATLGVMGTTPPAVAAPPVVNVPGKRVLEPTVLATSVLGASEVGSKMFSHSAAPAATTELQGKRIVVTAGATREYLDPVRFITNASSGTLGLTVCAALVARGAQVELIACGGLEVPDSLRSRLADVQQVQTAFDLQSAVHRSFDGADGLVMLAAVADYGPAQYSSTKHKKDGGTWNVDFGETPDVLASLKQFRRPGQVVLAVSLEDTDWLTRGQTKASKKGADALLAVELGPESPFGEARLHCALVRETGILAPATWRSKDEAAELLAGEMIRLLRAASAV